MRKKIPQLAAENGKTVHQFLSDLMSAHTFQQDAARAIGVSQPTLSQWLSREKIRRVYTPSQTEIKQE